MNKILICLSFVFFGSLFGGSYQVKNFSYLLGKLDGINDSVLEMHFTLYQGYVKNTNTLAQSLREMDDKRLPMALLQRRFGWEFDGMVLHELYFENLGGNRPCHPRAGFIKKL